MRGIRQTKFIPRLATAVVDNAGWISLALFLSGNLLFLALPLFAKDIFFDEKALLAGNASPKINDYDECFEKGDRFYEQCLSLDQRTTDSLPDTLRYLTNALDSDVSVQNFSVFISGRMIQCRNVHAVLQTSRGDGKEAILLHIPSYPVTELMGKDVVYCKAMRFGVILFQYLASVKWMSKNFIWLINDRQCGSRQSIELWLDAYHGMGDGDRSGTFQRGGLIGQAVVLDNQSPIFNSLEFGVESDNGQLSKLELYWLLRSAAKYVRPLKIGFLPGHFQSLCRNRYDGGSKIDKWRTMLCSVLKQALGVSTGSHGPFRRWSIDAVTISTKKQARSTDDPPFSFSDYELLNVMESVIRSCSNLVEKLNRSYYYYLLVSADRFVPIELYIIPVVLLLLSILLKTSQVKERIDWRRWPPALFPCLSFQTTIHFICLSAGMLVKFTMANFTVETGARKSTESSEGIFLWGWNATLVATMVYILASEIQKVTPAIIRSYTSSRKDTRAIHLMMTMGIGVLLLTVYACTNWCLAFIGAEILSVLSLSDSVLGDGASSRIPGFILVTALSPVCIGFLTLWLMGGTLPMAILLFLQMPYSSVLFWTGVYFPFWISFSIVRILI